MSDSTQPQAQAKVKNQKQISPVWIVPFIALLIGIWMFFQYINSTGPEITIKMPTAEGLEVGKTEIKSLNVNMGMVTAISLSENYDHILVKAQMKKEAERMLNDETQFWVVKPRIGSEGVSGLDTILSGAYIQIQPGKSSKKQLNFTALDLPPIAPLGSEGMRVVLSHDKAGKLNVGDPVNYQGFTVGRVEKASFDMQQKKALYQLFIFAPYNDLLVTGSQFWLTSGFDVKLDTDGFEVQIDSIESLLSGGVTFGVPEGEKPGEPFAEKLVRLSLFDNYEQVQAGLYKEYYTFMMEFDETIRGLNKGAPVEYRGIRIGTVLQAPYDVAYVEGSSESIKIHVLVKVEPERFFNKSKNMTTDVFENSIEQHFKNGLKAKLATGSLITGALYIETEFDSPSPSFEMTQIDGFDVFPTKKGEFAIVQQQFSSLLNKFNDLPLNEAIDSFSTSMDSLDKTLASAQATFEELNALVEQEATQALPLMYKKICNNYRKHYRGLVLIRSYIRIYNKH
ncbi:intermembrane transport protein PqiB [Psychromonas sp. KJ10-10]|uniref:intermembrane transport protein PqiB n=1 Tax=Psychromonas sp. KJ10-10 TaxID=3391823 RepID=UPI0039B6A78C